MRWKRLDAQTVRSWNIAGVPPHTFAAVGCLTSSWERAESSQNSPEFTGQPSGVANSGHLTNIGGSLSSRRPEVWIRNELANDPSLIVHLPRSANCLWRDMVVLVVAFEHFVDPSAGI